MEALEWSEDDDEPELDEGASSAACKAAYLAECAQLGLVPIALFLAKLDGNYLSLNHHGIGPKAVRALTAALAKKTNVYGLELNDNWLGDAGMTPIAAMLLNSSVLASLSLAKNRIGLEGVRTLCEGLSSARSLVELSLCGNLIDERAVAPLADALSSSPTLRRLDLSRNKLGGAAGEGLAELIRITSSLNKLNLCWNSLRDEGTSALASALQDNSSVTSLNLGWNGVGDAGAAALGALLASSSSLQHLDLEHNRIETGGIIALASGLRENDSLVTLELSSNPLGFSSAVPSTDGVAALIEVLRENSTLSSVGLSSLQDRCSFTRGPASRFNPLAPDGVYTLDLSQPWDAFIAETLLTLVRTSPGQEWIHPTLDKAPLDLVSDDVLVDETWTPPTTGVLQLNHTTWRSGMQAKLSFRLRESPADKLLANELVVTVRNSNSAPSAQPQDSGAKQEETMADSLVESRPGGGIDIMSEVDLDRLDTPEVKLIYGCVRPTNELTLPISLDLSDEAARDCAVQLWMRALTSSEERWKSATLDGKEMDLSNWSSDSAPEEGTILVEYAIRLHSKFRNKDSYEPMAESSFQLLHAALGGDDVSEEDRTLLVRLCAKRSRFTARQMAELLTLAPSTSERLRMLDLLSAHVANPRHLGQALVDKGELEGDLDALFEAAGISRAVDQGGESEAAMAADDKPPPAVSLDAALGDESGEDSHGSEGEGDGGEGGEHGEEEAQESEEEPHDREVHEVAHEEAHEEGEHDEAHEEEAHEEDEDEEDEEHHDDDVDDDEHDEHDEEETDDAEEEEEEEEA